MAIFPWLRSHERQGQRLEDYPNVKRWFEAVDRRPAVRRALEVLKEKRTGKMDERAQSILFGDEQYARR
jgi:GST-like protein